MIYLDNSATSYPKPPSITKSLLYSLKTGANPGRSGHNMSLNSSEQIYKVRKKITDFFGGYEPENTIFTSGCTHSINLAMRGLIPKGSHFIISSFEHNSVLRTAVSMKKELNCDFDVAPVSEDDFETLNNFKRLIRPETRAVICTHASNVTGKILPVKKISELCNAYGIMFILDASQTAGHEKINIRELGLCALCVPGHKGLFGLMGTGVLLLKDSEIKPYFTGGTGSESLNEFQPDYLPDRLESGTLNYSGILSLGSGMDFIQFVGIEKINSHEKALCNRLLDYLNTDKSYDVYSKKVGYSSIVSFNLKGLHSEITASKLNDYGIYVRAGYHCSKLAHNHLNTVNEGIVRVSPGFFNTEKDIDTLIMALEKIKNKK